MMYFADQLEWIRQERTKWSVISPIQPTRDIQALQIDDASVAYAKLGAEGVSENADENVRIGVKENELRSPYANIFEINPSD